MIKLRRPNKKKKRAYSLANLTERCTTREIRNTIQTFFLLLFFYLLATDKNENP